MNVSKPSIEKLDKFSQTLISIEEEIYNLNDKIAKAEEEAFIDVDMSGLTIVIE